jgi:hypothetical protein
MLKRGGEEEPGLRRNVNLFQAVMYGVGLILGAGIYIWIEGHYTIIHHNLLRVYQSLQINTILPLTEPLASIS